MAQIASAIQTAALAMSLARPERLWRSGPMRSTADSMAEFSSSTIITSQTLPASTATSTQPRPSQKASGTSTAASATSWRKARSPL